MLDINPLQKQDLLVYQSSFFSPYSITQQSTLMLCERTFGECTFSAFISILDAHLHQPKGTIWTIDMYKK